MSNKTPTKTVHRSSETGKFVPKEYVRAHPRTTETERVHVAPKPKGK